MIKFESVYKKYKENQVLKDINMEIKKGEMVVLIGPSGCGKTTSLKMINRLIEPSSGRIFIEGRDISEEDPIKLRRKIGYVIQQTGLFPHMTVAENIALLPSLMKWDKDKAVSRVKELLNLIGMEPGEFMNRYPRELSGGQQQRIGVARAFAVNPEIILMDEPFSALDPINRAQLQEELFNLQQELKKTVVFVTHDMDEALKLGDKISIMKEGEILQYNTPENILRNPSQGFVSEFIGKNRILNHSDYIKAIDVMIDRPVKAQKNRTVIQGMEIMKENNVDSILITDRGFNLEGIVTLKDLQRNFPSDVTLGDIMSKNLITVMEDDSISEVLDKMNNNSISFIPVITYENKLLGLITKSSLLKVIGSSISKEKEEL